MAKKIMVFKSIDQAVIELSTYGRTFSFPVWEQDDLFIISNSIGSNIYRALSHSENKPSEIYRSWIGKNLKTIVIDLKNVKSLENYSTFHSSYTDSLIRHWAKNSTDKKDHLGYGPASKIINLLVKTIQGSKKYNRKGLYPFIHVPFDEFSLKPLINIINDLTTLKYKITIPKSPTMSFITNPELYQIIQDAVVSLCRKAGISPLVYDYWSWNERH